MKLNFPTAMKFFTDQSGALWTADVHGQVDIGDESAREFLEAGFTVIDVGVNAVRPTATIPGMQFFDTTLNDGQGLPIWRNASNSGWINAAGVGI